MIIPSLSEINFTNCKIIGSLAVNQELDSNLSKMEVLLEQSCNISQIQRQD